MSKKKPRAVKPPRTIMVKAGEDLILPMPKGSIVGSNDRAVTDAKAVEVIFGSFVRRRLRSGDLVQVKTPTRPAKAAHKSSKAEG